MDKETSRIAKTLKFVIIAIIVFVLGFVIVMNSTPDNETEPVLLTCDVLRTYQQIGYSDEYVDCLPSMSPWAFQYYKKLPNSGNGVLRTPVEDAKESELFSQTPWNEDEGHTGTPTEDMINPEYNPHTDPDRPNLHREI